MYVLYLMFVWWFEISMFLTVGIYMDLSIILDKCLNFNIIQCFIDPITHVNH